MGILVNKGAKLNVKTVNSIPALRGKNYGDTALIWASTEGHDKVVKFLIDKKAVVNVQNDGGLTALIYASSKGHKKIVKYLLDANAIIQAASKENETALSLAKKNGHREIVKMLEKALAEGQA